MSAWKKYARQQRAVGLPVLPEAQWLAEVECGQANAEAWDELVAQQEAQEREGRKQIESDHALAADRNAGQEAKRARKFRQESDDTLHNNDKAIARREKVRRRLGGRR